MFKGLISLLFVMSFALTAGADSKAAKAPEKPVLTKEEAQIQQDLIRVTGRIVQIRKELQNLEVNKKGKSEKELQDRKSELQKEVSSLVGNFESMATRVPEEELPQKKNVKLNWSDALLEITRPLLLAIHEISDKPRKIDLHKAKIAALENTLERFKTAETHLDALASQKDLKDTEGKVIAWSITSAYKDQLKSLKKKYDPKLISLQLDETKRALEDIEASQGSIFEALIKTTLNFFRVRGLNLLVSFLTFLAIWFGLSFIYRTVRDRTPIFKHIRPSQRKVIQALSNMTFVATGLIGGIVSLYLQNDWLLLSLLLLTSFGVAWASRQLIPKFIEELRLILNLGAIRENERVVWHGIPYLIKEIGFYVNLENPKLQSGYLTLPVGELLEVHSRPIHKNEPWFPTKTGDWVLLDDGTFGQVNLQTIEQVLVISYGTQKFYSTLEFLSLKPKNLSNGFDHLLTFGLDYGVQDQVTERWVPVFQAELDQFKQDHDDLGIQLIEVEFKEAASSSLNLFVKVKFEAGHGEFYFKRERQLQTELVNICNRHGLTIPFNQLTLTWDKEKHSREYTNPAVELNH